MTTDERLNNLEDEIKKLKTAINHNNAVTRKINEGIKLQLTLLQTSVDKVKTSQMSSPFDFADFSAGKKS
jgi:hypothetical protein